MRFVGFLMAMLALTACGPRISGEVGKACISADRSAASNSLCSCVQQAANQTLSGRDQVLAATFFENPQLAQDTRQSDNRGSEAFWDRYKVFADTARRTCG